MKTKLTPCRFRQGVSRLLCIHLPLTVAAATAFAARTADAFTALGLAKGVADGEKHGQQQKTEYDPGYHKDSFLLRGGYACAPATAGLRAVLLGL